MNELTEFLGIVGGLGKRGRGRLEVIGVVKVKGSYGFCGANFIVF